MFGAILGLIIPIALVAVIVRAAQRRSELAGGSGSVSLRRFFQYVVLLGLLIVVALGVSGLLAVALPDSSTIAKRGSADEARALAFIVVGGPLFVAMVFWTRRRLEADPAERDSLGWAFYLTVSLLISVAVIMAVGVLALDWALSDGDLDTTEISQGMVWASIWVVHWLIARRAIAPLRMNPHLLAGSAAGLGVLAAGMALALGTALDSLYSQAFETVLVDDLEGLLLEAASLVIVGGVVWTWYWIRSGARAERSTVWNVYVLLLGVLGGLVTALIAAGVMIGLGLEWFIGDPEAASAVDHFSEAAEAATALLIGAAIWLYHRFVLGSGTRTEVHRTYDYILSAAGLLALAGGVALAIIALVDAATEPAGSIAASNQDGAFIAAITLLIVGAPLWWIAWAGLRRRVRNNPEGELLSPARRMYLFALLGVGAVTSIINLIVLVFIVLEDALDGNLGTRSIRDAEIAIGLLLAALAVAGYHWTVYQEDRAASPDAPKLRLREVVLIGVDAHEIGRVIADATGAKVHVWGLAEEVSGSLVAAEVIAALRKRDEEQLLIVQKTLGSFEITSVRR